MSRTRTQRRPRSAEEPALQLRLYGEVSDKRVLRLVEQLQAAPDAPVTLFINSPGGVVTEGFALASALRAHRGRKVAIVEGYCASAATFAACACDELHMHPESLLMIHNPWGAATGSAEDLESYAGVLRQMTELSVGLYQRKTGADEQTIRSWMNRETTLTPEQAQAAGFCDRILSAPAPPSAQLRTVRYAARLHLKLPQGSATPRNETMDPALRAKLAKHGLADDDSNLQSAYNQYLQSTDDGPKERQEMAKAVGPMLEDEPDKDLDEETSSTGSGQARGLRKDAHLDPAVQKLVDNLTGQLSSMKKAMEKQEQAARQRAEAEYLAEAEQHTSRDEAKEFLALAGGDIERALKLVRKLPAKNGAMGRWFAGGSPVNGRAGAGAGSGSSSAPAAAAEATREVNGGRVLLHGYGLAQAAKKIAADRKVPLAEAQRIAAREHPELVARTFVR
ncbi:MAG: Clp protease ClpP [Polyangia bacterium]